MASSAAWRDRSSVVPLPAPAPGGAFREHGSAATRPGARWADRHCDTRMSAELRAAGSGTAVASGRHRAKLRFPPMFLLALAGRLIVTAVADRPPRRGGDAPPTHG